MTFILILHCFLPEFYHKNQGECVGVCVGECVGEPYTLGSSNNVFHIILDFI